MYIKTYQTRWNDKDNFIFIGGRGSRIMACIEMTVFKEGDHKGEAYLWNLHVDEQYRLCGFGRELIDCALESARIFNCTRATLEWDIKDSPQWVFDWYTRLGFEEKKFGKGCAWMEKKL